MDDSADFHDLFNGDPTTVLGSPDLLAGLFWAEQNQSSSHQAHPQVDSNSAVLQTPQEHREGGSEEQAEEQDCEGQLLLLQEWDGTTEPSADAIRYTIEWKAVLKTKRIGTNTEEDVFLAPKAFWDASLRQKVDDSLDREFSPQERPELGSTIVVVSVNKRAERGLTKEFVGSDIDWTLVAEKLESWADHFRDGKRLTVRITFRFRPRATAPQTRAGGRGRQSATRRMRHEQALQRDAEEHVSGEAAPWRTVYDMMRCPGRPCLNNQGWCWRDPHGGRHHKLLTVHLRRLVEHVKESNKFESHSDVPDTIRQQLYAEAVQRAARHQHRNTGHPPSVMPYMQEPTPTPTQTPGTMHYSPAQEVLPSGGIAAAPTSLQSLDVPGPQEDAISDYVAWHQSKASTPEWTSQFAKAGEVLLEEGFNLDLFYQTKPFDLLRNQGVSRGITLSFHRDIPTWLPGYRQKREGSPLYTSETPGLDY